MPKIIEVDKGDFRAFVYESDIVAAPSPNLKMLPAAPLSPANFVASWQPSQDLLLFLVAWYLAEDIPAAFLDIGANIGTDAIRIAKLARLLSRRLPIVAFEPGVNAALLPYTLSLNGSNEIIFEEICVSDRETPTILFGENDVSLNNRIVNRRPETEGFCKIVHSTTIDAYVHKPEFHRRHLIAKIDTQGAEWLVWQGIKPIAERATLLMEFTPWALEPFVSPATFLDELSGPYWLFDLGYARDRFLPISNFGDFLTRIQKPPHHWTDILCIPRGQPSNDALIVALRAAFA